jgi:hypothetical protein
MKTGKSIFISLIILSLTLCLTSCTDDKDEPKTAKPVIYLYPEEKTDVSVKLDYNGELFVTYPNYNNGWNVTAYPDGTIINKADNEEYSSKHISMFSPAIPDKIPPQCGHGYSPILENKTRRNGAISVIVPKSVKSPMDSIYCH